MLSRSSLFSTTDEVRKSRESMAHNCRLHLPLEDGLIGRRAAFPLTVSCAFNVRLEGAMGWTIALVIVIVLVVLIAAVLVIAAMKPDNFRVQRIATINASPEKIFPHINDFHNWQAWSPWEKLDPALNRTFSGTANGKGSVYDWEGNKQVGKGRMEITESSPPSKIVIKLDFFKPFEAHNTSDFTFAGQGDSTTVTWGMNGQMPFFFKVMTIVTSMDKMIGKDFEKGLASLKEITEKGATNP
jgi:hypothetical protein